MIIREKVYNFTSYLPNHPGGLEKIVPYCGKDATMAFETKDKNPVKPHSKYAESLLNQYYIGDADQKLKSEIGKDPPIQTPPIVNTPIISSYKPVISKTPVKIPTPTSTPSTPITISTSTPTNQPFLLTSNEVAQHNSANDCFIIISNKIYNITNFLPYHPGGINAILPYCGKDGTAAFANHSQNANNILSSYYIGELNNNPISTPASTPAPTSIPDPTLTPIPPAPTPILAPTLQPPPPREEDED